MLKPRLNRVSKFESIYNSRESCVFKKYNNENWPMFSILPNVLFPLEKCIHFRSCQKGTELVGSMKYVEKKKPLASVSFFSYYNPILSHLTDNEWFRCNDFITSSTAPRSGPKISSTTIPKFERFWISRNYVTFRVKFAQPRNKSIPFDGGPLHFHNDTC